MKLSRYVAGSVLLMAVAACSSDAPTRPSPLPPASPVLAKGGGGGSGGSGGSTATLEICKVGGTGVTPGTSFEFTVTRAGVSREIAVAAGSCTDVGLPLLSTPLSKGGYRKRLTLIEELLPAGSTLDVGGTGLDAGQVSAIMRGSADVQASSALLLNLVQQLVAARLNMLQGIQPTQAVLAAIAAADGGIDVVTGPAVSVTTTLSVAGMSALVETLTAFNEGSAGMGTGSATLEVDEAIPTSMTATIVCSPADRCSNLDPAAGKVTATVLAGATTRVEFTNAVVPPLTVCKVAGPGVAPGALYSFIVAAPLGGATGAQITVAAGDCEDLFLAPAYFQVAETIPDNEVVSSIVCDPADRCTSTSTTQLSAFLNVVSGSNTRVTFTNRSTLGTLRVCKVGNGIAAGTLVRFQVFDTGTGPGDTELNVAVGQCGEVTVPEGNYQVLEDIPAGTTVTDIACEPQPRCGTENVSLGYAFLDIAGGMTTTMTFTNTAASPAMSLSMKASARAEATRANQPSSQK